MPHLWSTSRRACVAACGGAQRGSREAAWGGAQREQGGRGDAVLEAVERAATEETVGSRDAQQEQGGAWALKP